MDMLHLAAFLAFEVRMALFAAGINFLAAAHEGMEITSALKRVEKAVDGRQADALVFYSCVQLIRIEE